VKFKNPEVEKQVALYMAAGAGNNLLLAGPSGTGKTMLARQMTEEFGRALYKIVGRESMQDVNMLGTFVSRRDGVIEWVDGPLSKAFRAAANGEPTVMFIDELTRIPTKHQNVLIEAINQYDDEHYVLENLDLGETLVAPTENLTFIAACNLGQEGTSVIPEALKDRFHFVYVDYPPAEIEAEILKEAGMPEEFVAPVIEFAQDTRRQANDMLLEMPVSTRTLVSVSRNYTRLSQRYSLETQEDRNRLLLALFQSPIIRCVGAGESPDWQEKASGLKEALVTLIESSTHTSVRSTRKKRGRRTRAQSGSVSPSVSPISI